MIDTTATAGEESEALNRLFSCLASGHRRHLLGRLYERAPESLTYRDLAMYLDPLKSDDPGGGGIDEGFYQTFLELHHLHLPKLEASGLVDRDRNRGTVKLSDHPAFRDAGIVDVIVNDANADPRSLDALFSALDDGFRRTIFDVLSHQYHPIRTETLAREIIARKRNISERDVGSGEIETVLLSLLHTHLPKLSRTGLIDYDDEGETVSYVGHPALRVPWIHSCLSHQFRGRLTGNSTAHEVETLEGREKIVSYGQSLCEIADEELFLMFTTTGLLEAGCFSRIRDAVERGVAVYLGTSDPTVREFVREHAPEVTLWEPQVDWLNLPVEDGKVGRLVFADRKSIMLGTLGEEDDNGVHVERAIIGEGANNTFVVLMKQMLNSHLGQFGEQCEVVQSRFPF